MLLQKPPTLNILFTDVTHRVIIVGGKWSVKACFDTPALGQCVTSVNNAAAFRPLTRCRVA